MHLLRTLSWGNIGRRSALLAALVLGGLTAVGHAQSSNGSAASTAQPGAEAPPAESAGAQAADPAYRLNPSDQILISIFSEPDMASSHKIDLNSKIRVPLLGEISLADHTVRSAEEYLEKLYQEKQILRKPLVSIRVTAYAPRLATVLGAVRSPGNFQFPSDTTSIDIVDLITRMGGFTPVAKSSEVIVTRIGADGKETVTTLDVESMMTGRRRNDRTPREFAVLPGDRLRVPERLF